MKKILGYVFIGIGGFLGISILLQIPAIFKEVSNVNATDTSTEITHDFGFVMGKIIAMLIIITIIGFLIWLGRKWTKQIEAPKKLQETQKNTPEL